MVGLIERKLTTSKAQSAPIHIAFESNSLVTLVKKTRQTTPAKLDYVQSATKIQIAETRAVLESPQNVTVNGSHFSSRNIDFYCQNSIKMLNNMYTECDLILYISNIGNDYSALTGTCENAGCIFELQFSD